MTRISRQRLAWTGLLVLTTVVYAPVVSKLVMAANNLACLYVEEGRLDDALKQALVARGQMPGSPEANDTLGWIYLQRGEAARALAPLRDAVGAHPGNTRYRSHLAVAYARTGAP